MLTFLIPIEPVAKGRPRFSRRGHAYTPDKTRVFERDVKFFCYQQMIQKQIQVTDKPLKVSIRFGLKLPKKPKNKEHITRPDIENLAKSVLDALNEIVYKDDSQICELNLRKIYSASPHIYITIETL